MASNIPTADDSKVGQIPTPLPAESMEKPRIAENAAPRAARAPRRAPKAATRAAPQSRAVEAAPESVAPRAKRTQAPKKRAAAKPKALASSDAKPATPRRSASAKLGAGAKAGTAKSGTAKSGTGARKMSLPLSGKGLAGMAATIGVVAAGLTAAIGRKRIAKALGEPARKSGSRKKAGKSKS